MRLGGGTEEEPLVWYGVISVQIPCVKGRWQLKTFDLWVGKGEPLTAVVVNRPNPAEDCPRPQGFRLPPTAPEKYEKLTFNVIFKQKKIF